MAQRVVEWGRDCCKLLSSDYKKYLSEQLCFRGGLDYAHNPTVNMITSRYFISTSSVI